jgi:hydroxymethylpyrimidine pyrophosphatase-like HAD family hydrolase
MLKIAVDFDGTIVEDRYPGIGKPHLFAFETLKALQQQQHQLILWTVREGKALQEAKDFCKNHGIEFYAINKNFPEEELEIGQSRKLNVDHFIDDRSVGGFIGWSKVWELLGNNPVEYTLPKKSFWGKLKDLFK